MALKPILGNTLANGPPVDRRVHGASGVGKAAPNKGISGRMGA